MATPKAKTAAKPVTKPTAAPTAHAKDAKADKFVELAQKRVTRAINSIRSVAKLSNRASYHFTDEQITKISEALRDEVVAMNESFTRDPSKPKIGFTL